MTPQPMNRSDLFLPCDLLDADVLVLGGGIAGHRAAVAAREQGASVTIAYLAHGASAFVIACNAPLGHADPRDSSEVYFADMLRGGCGLNERALARALATQTPDALHELAALGVPFSRDGERFRQRHLSGNTYPRSVYVPEGTGRILLEHLAGRAKALGVTTLGGSRALSLLLDGEEVVGALLIRPHGDRLVAVRARAVVLATGGIGRLYADSTYPSDVAAGSYALAFDAGATLVDMEFVQFEPVVTVHPEACRSMEMPTAMLGDGARLLNSKGERFMFGTNPEHGEKRIEKALLALSIQREINEGRGFPDGGVLFDTTTVPREKLESYVSHCRRLRAAGLDPAVAGPHVRPAAHSEMGGILIDERGWSGVPSLYACGEAAGGVHGASRLAGNGGSDAIVFGALAGRGAVAGLLDQRPRDWPAIIARAGSGLSAALGRPQLFDADDIKATVRRIMGEAAGIYRTGERLARAEAELALLAGRLETGAGGADLAGAVRALEARNMVLAARIIIAAARTRRESRGAHQRRDFPETEDGHWLRHIVVTRGGDGEPNLATMPVR